MVYDCNYRVYYYDTDRMGVMYHAGYLKIFEYARTEMLRSEGISCGELERRGFIMPVTESYCRYLKPAAYDDLLLVRTRVEELRRASVKIATEVRRGGELLCSGYVRLACVDSAFRPVRMPEDLKNCCEKFLTSTEN